MGLFADLVASNPKYAYGGLYGTPFGKQGGSDPYNTSGTGIQETSQTVAAYKKWVDEGKQRLAGGGFFDMVKEFATSGGAKVIGMALGAGALGNLASTGSMSYGAGATAAGAGEAAGAGYMTLPGEAGMEFGGAGLTEAGYASAVGSNMDTLGRVAGGGGSVVPGGSGMTVNAEAAAAAGGTGETLATLGGAAGAGGAISSLKNILSNGGSVDDWLKMLGPAMSIGSGLYGMDQAKDLSGSAEGDVNAALGNLNGLSINPEAGGAASTAAINAADPWSASGGRALADEQLQALMRDPSQAAANDPAYKLRIQGAQRAMGAYGQDSGAMSVAGAGASTTWLDQRLASLAGLENLGNPVGAQQVGIEQGQLNLAGQKAQADLGLSKAGLGMDAAKLNLAARMGGNSLAGQSLASLGYGVTSATGGTTFNSQQIAQLQQLLKMAA
jgi:hypothetical protein